MVQLIRPKLARVSGCWRGFELTTMGSDQIDQGVENKLGLEKGILLYYFGLFWV